MSDYNVVNAVDETLRTLLWTSMQADSVVSSIITTEQQITIDSPSVLIENDTPAEDYLSLFLYRVVENGDLRNRPPEQLNQSRLRNPPLSLNLFYLVTPLTKDTGNDHRLLSKTMQILYDSPILKGSQLQGVLQDTSEELRITLHSLSMEDLGKLWGAFMRPMRLSVSYEVKVVYIDSTREMAGEQVRRKQLDFSQIV